LAPLSVRIGIADPVEEENDLGPSVGVRRQGSILEVAVEAAAS
jgi:hypothetical protein